MSDYKYELERDDRNCAEAERERENSLVNVSPQDIMKFQKWLKFKEPYIIKEVEGEYMKGVSKAVVKLVIATLMLDLNDEAENSMEEMVHTIEREG